jgi:hypothetical protein
MADIFIVFFQFSCRVQKILLTHKNDNLPLNAIETKRLKKEMATFFLPPFHIQKISFSQEWL